MNETAVCNLASIGLPTYISQKVFNHSLLGEKVRNIVRNLNRVIDINFYPTECAKRSNMRHRPIGLGVQGLADVFMELDMDWETKDAHKLNSDIFETIYYYSLLESVEQAKLYGPYETFSGSPASQGILQFDMWPSHSHGSLGYDWNSLKEQVKTHGLRNSVLVSPMPTASTSQILGFTECFEPITSNIFTRRTLAGSFVVMNHRLMKDLIELGLWNEDMKNEIIRNEGSVQDITSIPKPLKDKYKTVWEIKQKTLIDMSAERGRYICQSQSLNLYLSKIDINRLGSMHLYAWKQGLKTGLYYLRIKPVAKTQQFTVEPVALTNSVNNVEKKDKEPEQKEEPVLVCRREAGCITCSS
jgi:ribonucleoside-diphosphate reductase alpha chain